MPKAALTQTLGHSPSLSPPCVAPPGRPHVAQDKSWFVGFSESPGERRGQGQREGTFRGISSWYL